MQPSDDPYEAFAPDHDDLRAQPELPTWRSAVVSLLLTAAVFLERMAYYGTRSVLFLWLLYDMGLPEGEAGEWFASLSTGLVLAPMLGGALAVLTGPYPLLVLGALVSVASYGAFLVAPSTSLYLPFGLMLVGQGLMKPALYAIAGTQFRGSFGNLRTLLFALIYGAINVGAVLSVAVAWRLEAALGSSAIYPVAAGLSLLVALLAAATWAVDWGRQAEPPLDGRALRRFGAGLLLLPMGFAFWFMGGAVAVLLPRDVPSALFSLNPVVVTAFAVLLVLVLAAAQLAAKQIPAFPVIALALLLGAGAGLLPVLYLLFPGYELGIAIFALTTVALALPETMVGAFALSRLTGDLPSRLSPLLVAGWFSASWSGSFLGDRAIEWVGATPVLAASLLACALAAVVALVLWKPLEAAAWRSGPSDEGPGIS